MSFREIEGLIGATLPPVAFRHRAWWSNNPSNSVITRAWLDAGYRTERVDMGSQKLVFRRAEPATRRPQPGWLARLREELGGTVRIAPHWDLTNPTGEPWDAERQ